MDRTSKLILAAIALGVWINAAYLFQLTPAVNALRSDVSSLQTDVSTIETGVSSIEGDAGEIVVNTTR